ncbi:MAG: hypothetical protein HUJ63_07055 [Enterococcus sp.]|nr:hypothetical protein [Enterococcus sp.]
MLLDASKLIVLSTTLPDSFTIGSVISLLTQQKFFKSTLSSTSNCSLSKINIFLSFGITRTLTTQGFKAAPFKSLSEVFAVTVIIYSVIFVKFLSPAL